MLQTVRGIEIFSACAGSSLFGRGHLAGGTTLIKEDLSLRDPPLTQVNRDRPQDQKVLQHSGTVVHKCIVLYVHMYFRSAFSFLWASVKQQK